MWNQFVLALLPTNRYKHRVRNPVQQVNWYRGLSRREFVRIATTAMVASGMVSCSRLKTPWRFLTAEEARTLAAICDQLIPPDEYAGAAWAGVVNFMDIQLCGAYRRLRDSYREGIASFERDCRERYGKSFAEITSAVQVEFLHAVEKGELHQPEWTATAQTRFFELVRSHTMQGFYGDPRHGGNRDRVSWKMVGLSYPPIRGQQKY